MFKENSPLTYDLHMYTAIHWQGEREEGEGVEANTGVATSSTAHCRLELSVKEIHHDGLVPQQMVIPCLEHDEMICRNPVYITTVLTRNLIGLFPATKNRNIIIKYLVSFRGHTTPGYPVPLANHN